MALQANPALDPHAETVTKTAAIGSPTTDHPDSLPLPLPTIPGYRILRRLGGGGMGDVYEAVDEALGVTFALKMVRPDRTALAYSDRFRQEVKAMMVLDHPNVARIYHHDDVDGWPYFTMKYVRGGTLADRRTEIAGKPWAAVALMIKVADAVQYLHEHGMVHRDLKPSNILLDETGTPILSDFGLVKDVATPMSAMDGRLAESTPDNADTRSSPLPAEAPTLTRTGGVLGTYAYMSPEQACGKKDAVAPTTDIWALGVILHELLAGHRPGDRPTDEAGTSRKGARAEQPPPITDLALARIVDKCLVQDPRGRYASAAHLAEDLRQWQSTASRSRRPAAILVAAIALLTVLIAVAVLRPRPDTQSTPPDARAWMRSELRAGRPVTLVDANGVPTSGFQFLGSGGTAHADRDPGGWWTVHTTAESLIEFLDDPGIDSFTVSGEIRGNRLASIPNAGLFVAHRRVTGDGDWHFQLEYVFDECVGNFPLGPPPPGLPGPPPPKSKDYIPVKIVPVVIPPGKRLVRLRGSQLAEGAGNCPEELKRWEFGLDAPIVGGPWRQMGIRASGTTFTMSWGGQDEYTASDFPAWRLDKMQLFLRERPDPPLKFSARGGLGVYVAGGSASFRNVVVVPGP